MPKSRKQFAQALAVTDKAIQVAEKMLALGHDTKLVKVLDECLSAQRRFWVKDSDKDGHWEVEPDYQTRIKAVTVGMSYLFGLPPQRSEVVSLNANLNVGKDGQINLNEIADPALRSKVLMMMSQAGKSSPAAPAPPSAPSHPTSQPDKAEPRSAEPAAEKPE